ncbi:hypothetical protein V9T40_002557 [Parthenolecanium corni]|uniref:Charged multivesicular body protein 6 n=1 Tax=Parthenolecanium corni TaxID=536013 RepID=A0AAN9Y4B6_9HEMI
MGIFFSKRKKISRVTDHDKAVLQLKIQRDNVKKYQQRIEQTLEKDRNLAKRLLAEGKRERAKLLLKKKRYQEQLLEKTDGQLENLEKLTQDLEFAQIETKVVEGLQIGNTALKKINEMLDIANIEQILDETREGVEKQNEINALLSGEFTAEDDEAIENELSELISDAENIPELPQVPKEEPKVDIETPVIAEEPKKREKAKDREPIMLPA